MGTEGWSRGSFKVSSVSVSSPTRSGISPARGDSGRKDWRGDASSLLFAFGVNTVSVKARKANVSASGPPGVRPSHPAPWSQDTTEMPGRARRLRNVLQQSRRRAGRARGEQFAELGSAVLPCKHD